MPGRHRYQPGLFPIKVIPSSQAAEAGVQTGDILMTINEEPVIDGYSFRRNVCS